MIPPQRAILSPTGPPGPAGVGMRLPAAAGSRGLGGGFPHGRIAKGRRGSRWHDDEDSARSSGASAPTGEVTYRARYAMPDGTRHSRTFGTKMDAEAWLATERSLIDRDEWTPPRARKVAEAKRAARAARTTR